MRVHGLVHGSVAEIISVTYIGTRALIRFRDDFGLDSTRTLGARELANVRPVDGAALTLAASHDDFWLAIEALRLRFAHLLNPLLAVASSNLEPLPHQVQAVYDYLLREHPLRFLLADDPGAGKTIMAGLFIKETLARGWVQRCLIVVPGSLAEQWKEELEEKFGLAFEIFDTSMVNGVPPNTNPLESHPFLIARLDQFARNQSLVDVIARSPYDLAIFDEAHKLSARAWGSRIVKSRRFEFGETIRDLSPSLLLMTATPHSGKEGDFQRFLSLLESGTSPSPITDAVGVGLMRRLVKEQLVRLDGTRLFPERRANTVAYRLSTLERSLYEDVSEYVREEMNKVADEETQRTVGFALLVLQRRLASSPQAILRSLTRRRDRLQAEVIRLEHADRRLAETLAASFDLQPDDPDDLSSADAETYEDDTASVATAARSLADLETEILVLDRLVRRAEAVRGAHVDAKWDALAELLTSPQMYDEDGLRRKIVIFTEHRDTLEYLEDRLFEVLPAKTGVEVIHGAISRDERRLAQVRFTQGRDSSILLATDAAGEGVNLQAAHLMVNYDIPWNPNRLEQRFGRIHRIGQRHVCHLWNLVAVDTREGDVFATLLEKLEVQRQALGDQVFDVLGQVLTDASLEQLLSRALDGAAGDEVRSALDRVSRDIETAVQERAAGVSSLTPKQIAALRKSMQLSQAGSFQPGMVRDFTLRAMATLQGVIEQHGQTWRIRHVPESARSTFGSSVRPRYDAVTFERSEGPILSSVVPEFIAPGHPVLGALVKTVDQTLGKALIEGVMLEDDRASSDYTLVTVLTDTASPEQRALTTYAVTSGAGECTPADPALYTSLGPGTGQPADVDLEAATRAVAAVVAHSGSERAKVVATAHVRGTAAGSTARAWQHARAQLADALRREHGNDHVTEALPGAGWDFMIDVEGTCFIRAIPDGHPALQRRAEQQVAANVGKAYLERAVDTDEQH